MSFAMEIASFFALQQDRSNFWQLSLMHCRLPAFPQVNDISAQMEVSIPRSLTISVRAQLVRFSLCCTRLCWYSDWWYTV